MNKSEQFLQAISSGVLLGDGAMGTALFARGAIPTHGVERLNVLAPSLVAELHRAYIAAGSRVIETNTFAANRPRLAALGAEVQLADIIQAGVRLAREAAGAAVFVAGAVGPLPHREQEDGASTVRASNYTELIALLLEGGVDLLLLESFTQLDDLVSVITLARALWSGPIVAQMAFDLDGTASDGETAETVARRCLDAGAQVVGANCGYGAPAVLNAIARMQACGAPLSAYLNAGVPEVVEGRRCYQATPDYLAMRARDLVAQGVRLIGGCCGTDPATIWAMALALQAAPTVTPVRLTPRVAMPAVVEAAVTAPAVAAPPVIVELDPPLHVEVAPVLEAARQLHAAGVSAITVADNPLASPRLDAVMLAGLIHHVTGAAVIPHLTGRDRNRLALQSTIMGAHVLGLRGLLCITGDPVRLCQETNTSGVFDVTSVGLVRLVQEFNAGQRMLGAHSTAFRIGVAVNPNVRNLVGQIDKLLRKIEAGAAFALTQPIFDIARAEQFAAALDAADIRIPIYLGVYPLFSARNAEYLHNEVPGMVIPDALRARLQAQPTPDAQRKEGVRIACELIRQYTPHATGWYFVTPRNRVAMVLPLLQEVQRGYAARTASSR